MHMALGDDDKYCTANITPYFDYFLMGEVELNPLF